MPTQLTTARVAKKVGITRNTLQRWIRTGQVKAPKIAVRNGRAIRLWSSADIKRLTQVKSKTYRKGRGRKVRTGRK